MSPPTMQEVANECGVSVSTVSLTFSNHPRIPAATKEKILRKARELNYKPNLFARSLVKRQSSPVIAVLTPKFHNVFSDPFCVRALEGIYTTAQKNDYKILFEITSEDFYKNGECRSLFGSGLVGGLIILGGNPDEYGYVKKIAKEYPVVIVGGYLPSVAGPLSHDSIERLPHSSVPFVTGDNFKGGYIATKHLTNLGRKKIGIITGGLEVLSAKDRYNGYIKALGEACLKFDQRLVVNGYFKEWESYLATKDLLKLYPDAIFAGNDLMAIGAMCAIKEAGLKIPEDISIVGMDNISQSELTDPPLTTVQYPVYAMGAYAAESIITHLKGNNRSEKNVNGDFKTKKVFDISLVVRKSCGG